MPSKRSVPQGMRESTPVERTLELHESASSAKQESLGFSHGERQAELLGACRVLAFCGLDTTKDCDGCALNDADMRVEIDPTAACDGLRDLLRKIGIEVSA